MKIYLQDIHHLFILDPFIVLRIFITITNASCNSVQWYQQSSVRNHILSNTWFTFGALCYSRRIYNTLFPLTKQSPYFLCNCPFTYSSVCSSATFIYPSKHVRRPSSQFEIRQCESVGWDTFVVYSGI